MVLTGGLLATSMVLDVVVGGAKALGGRMPDPDALIGRGVDRLAARLRTGADAQRQGKRFAAVLVGVAVVAGLLIAVLPGGVLWQVLLGTLLLGHHALIDGVRRVANGFAAGLPTAQAELARLSCAETGALDEGDVAAAAIEHGAAGFASRVVAPGFWFLLAGLPGLLGFTVLRVAADRLGRTDDFAGATRRAAELAAFVPARLAAVLVAAAAGRPAVLVAARRDGGRHAEPNEGWPQAAMAAALGIGLGGPRREGALVVDRIRLNEAAGRSAAPTDIAAAVGLLWRAWVALLALAAFVWVSF